MALVLAAVFAIGASVICLWLTETHLRGWWPWPEPPPLTLDDHMRLMAESFHGLGIALGEALIPAVRQITESFDQFGRQLNTATVRDCLACGRARSLGGPLVRCARHIDLPVLGSTDA